MASVFGEDEAELLRLLSGRSDVLQGLEVVVESFMYEPLIRQRAHSPAARQYRARLALRRGRVTAACRQLQDVLGADAELAQLADVNAPGWRNQLSTLIDIFDPGRSTPTPRGRPANPSRGIIEADTAAVLSGSGIRVTTYESGTFARVLRIVYRAAGVPTPQNMFRVLQRAVELVRGKRRELRNSAAPRA